MMIGCIFIVTTFVVLVANQSSHIDAYSFAPINKNYHLRTGLDLVQNPSAQLYLGKHISSRRIATSLPSSTTESIKVVEPFGVGLRKDIKNKAPYYWSDFKDGFRIKALSSTFFLFFACLAPAVAFGGLLGVATGGTMGTMETVNNSFSIFTIILVLLYYLLCTCNLYANRLVRLL